MNPASSTQLQIRHVYIHIPFCHRICPYCSFYKHTPGKTSQKEFIDTLLAELDLHARYLDIRPRTLYLGGGTPSMLSPQLLDRLVTGLHDRLNFQAIEDFTFEANPATFTKRKAEQFKELGITRVSLGVQSWDATVLQTLGREHSPEQAAESFYLLREVGIPEINIDQMFSIPGQSLDSWQQSLQQTLDLKPEHISAYNLTYEEDTEFFNQLISGSFQQSADQDADFFELAHQTLEAAGYLHYETSNFAQPGFESNHNRAYWRGEDYLGLGPGAVSTINRQRWTNLPDTARYIEQVRKSISPAGDHETIDTAKWHLERLALMLRTTQGIEIDCLQTLHRLKQETTASSASPPHTPTTLNEKINHLVAHGLIENRHRTLRTTQAGQLLVDAIVDYLS